MEKGRGGKEKRMLMAKERGRGGARRSDQSRWREEGKGEIQRRGREAR